MGEDLSPGQAGQTPENYGPDGGEVSQQPETHQAIEAAAVRGGSETGAPPQETSDAALRARVPQPPLTEQDIAKLTEHRGKRPTEEEITYMNRAREQGTHTSIV